MKAKEHQTVPRKALSRAGLPREGTPWGCRTPQVDGLPQSYSHLASNATT